MWISFKMIFEVFSFVVTILVALFFYIKHRRRYWRDRKVSYLDSKNILLGNAADVFLGNTSLYEYHAKMYNEFHPSDKFGGYYNFLNPSLIIRDPELIKKILTKDFDSFMDRNSNSILDENEPLSLHLFNLSGERWKILRQKLTPTFTSGKIKKMFYLMKECSEELVRVIDGLVSKGKVFEMRDIMARYVGR